MSGRRYDHEAIKAIFRGDPIPPEDMARIPPIPPEELARIEHLRAIENDRRRWCEADRQETLRIYKAMMLARNVDDCTALLRGEDVPAERLDPYWLRMYGMDGGEA